VLDIKKIGAIAKKHNLIYIVDASQTAGVFPIDMKAMNIDILCFTGHKGLLGPQGTGGMCVREGLTVKPLKSGGSGVTAFINDAVGFS
jgi:selenocysteine lyase/cysteine desulfurase